MTLPLAVARIKDFRSNLHLDLILHLEPGPALMIFFNKRFLKAQRLLTALAAVSGAATRGPDSTHALKEPPQFELCVLEALLEHVAVHLERSFQQVESVAEPGLPALRVKVRLPQVSPAAKMQGVLASGAAKRHSRRVIRAVQVSQTRLEWLRRLRIDIAQLSTTVTSVRI